VAAGGRVLGEAFIVISPDTDSFRAELTAQVKAAVTGVTGNVKISADTSPVTAAMTRVRAELAAAAAKVANIRFSADDTAVSAAVTRLLNKIALLDKQMRSMELAANPAKLDAAIAKEATKLAGLETKLRNLQMGADTGKIDAAIAREVTATAGLQRKLSGLQLTLDDAEAAYELKHLEGQAAVIRRALEKIPGDIEDTELKKKLDVIVGRINVINSDARRIELAAKTTLLFSQLSAAEDHLMRLRAEGAGIRLMNEAQIHEVQAGIAAVTAEMEILRAEADRVRLGGLNMSEITSVAAGIAGIDHEVAKLNTSLAGTAIGPPGKALGELRIRAEKLDEALAKAKIELGGEPAAEAKLAALQLHAEKLRVTLADLSIGGDPVKLAAATAGVAALAAGLRGLVPAVTATEGAWAKLQSWAFKGGGGLWGLGSAIGGVKLWHVVLDGVIEAIIAVTGAVIAATAGVAALSESMYDVGVRFQAVRTVSSALGTDIPPLTGKFDDLMTAMAPRSIEIFGGALGIVRSQAQDLQKVIEPVVDLFDTWVAEIDIWVSHQQTFAGAITHGTGYLAQFGQIVGQITEAIHNLLSKDPGIAHYLLEILVAASALFDAFTKLPKPIVELTIGLHGLYVWALVLSGIFLKMVNPLVTIVTWVTRLGTASKAAAAEVALLADTQLAETAAADAQAVSGLGGALGRAGTAARGFGAGLATLAANPFVWAAAAIALIGGIVYEMHQAGRATKDFIGGMTAELNQMKASDAIPAIEADIGQLNTRIQTAFGPENISRIQGTFGGNSLISMGRFRSNLIAMGDAAAAWGHVFTDVFGGHASRVVGDFGRLIGTFGAKHDAAMHQASEEVKAYDAQLTKLRETQGTYFRTIGALVKEHYSVAESFALMDLAGVKANDTFEVAHQKVENLITGYKNITGTGGPALEASVNAVTFATLQQTEKVAQLNQGWDTFMKTIEGGEQAFTSFATQTEGLYQSLSNAGVKLSDSNGKVSMSTKLAADAAQGGKVSMTGLNTASLQARDTFLRTADAAGAQMDALNLLANAAGLGDDGVRMLSRANKDLVASMLPAAKGSQAMTDILYALAQRGGYQGANSFKALSSWVGKTKDPMHDLDKITTTLTTDAANLTQDVKNLSIALGTNLNAAMAQALITASGGQKMFTDFASAILKTGVNSKNTHDTALKLAQGLVDLTGNTADAKNQFEAFAQQGLHLTHKQAQDLWNSITKQLQPAMNDTANKTVPATRAAFEGWAGANGGSGLGLSRKQADLLWGSLTGPGAQALNDLTKNKTPAAKKAFEAWAGADGASGLGLTRKQADLLWQALAGPNGLQHAIDALHGKHIDVTMKGTGSYTIRDATGGHAFGPQAAGTIGKQFGGALPGYGGGDRIHALLEAGETVLPKEATRDPLTHLVAAKYKVPGFAQPRGGHYGLPGFASGGIAGAPPTFPPYSGNLTAQYITDMGKAFDKQFGDSFVKQLAGSLKKAEQAFLGSGSSIVNYALSFLGKIPYVWGGTTAAGADCSGFTGMVLSHFGYAPPRTSEAQGGWVTRAPPTPGGLAFYHSPPGGADPGHVAIIKDAMTVISQGGGMGPTLEALSFLPLLWTGVPPGGFRSGASGLSHAPAGGGIAAEQRYAFSLFPRYGWGPNQQQPLIALWNKESGWNPNAVNPSSGAYGIPQALGHGHPYNLGDWPAQIQWGLNYIAGRYGWPDVAWNHEQIFNWYAKGGIADYAERAAVFAQGHGPGRTGASLQRSVPIGFDRGGVLAPGMTLAVNSTGKPETVIPAPPHEVLSRFQAGGVVAGHRFPAWPLPHGTQSVSDFWADAMDREKTEKDYYAHVVKGFATSLAHARHGTWWYSNRSAIRGELATLAARQQAEEAAYAALGKPGTVPSASALSHLVAAARAEARVTQDQALVHGHPALMIGVYQMLGQLAQTAGTGFPNVIKPFTTFGAPPLPKPGTPEYITLASIYGWYDRGGILPPGLTLAYNGTGRNEVVSPVPPGGTIGPGGMTPGEMQVINRLDRLIALMGAAPAAYSQALNGVAGRASSRGYYGSVR
jgi:NlpC/P60 family